MRKESFRKLPEKAILLLITLICCLATELFEDRLSDIIKATHSQDEEISAPFQPLEDLLFTPATEIDKAKKQIKEGANVFETKYQNIRNLMTS